MKTKTPFLVTLSRWSMIEVSCIYDSDTDTVTALSAHDPVDLTPIQLKESEREQCRTDSDIRRDGRLEAQRVEEWDAKIADQLRQEDQR